MWARSWRTSCRTACGVLVLSKLYGVEIEKEFMKTMDELDGWMTAKKKE